ncbi:MAG: YggS family pyridoxal phosphate-dependent enzyme [Erysipelotrichia bacterium]|nr:YggS family pyridoxal phosphate-dependent enzyme [Erysipelotrichia bacterium]NCC55223.1 YggS family pyridoxal phosphate-dependent enzyme [Erysipelotrichia bacterium]
MNRKLYEEILKECQDNTKLIVVSKYRSEEQLLEYYEAGQRAFAENRVQEMCEKQAHLPNDIEWHMIGHLQRNKVKYIIPFVHMIHSIHSLSLLDEVEKQAAKCQRVIDVCIQFNLAKEESKSGFAYEQWEEVMAYAQNKTHVRVVGIMVMGPHVDDEKQIASVFLQAQSLLTQIQAVYAQVHELSMGMSHDYKLAIKAKATMIRVGSILFS